MKLWRIVVPEALVLLLAAIVVGQVVAPKRIALTGSSSVDSGTLAKTMDKNFCSGIILTLDASKADYLLEASTNAKDFPSFTLFSPSGDILYHTNTRRYKNAMKDVCNFIKTGKK